jgi:NAD-dependent DNA ligase
MMETFDRSYLVIQGTPLWQADGGFKNYEDSQHRWRRSHSNISLRRLLGLIMKIEELGCRTIFMPSQQSALTYISMLYSWWSKPWTDHSKAVYWHEPTLSLISPSLRQKIASLLPGVGQAKLMEIDREFSSTREMVAADTSRWMNISRVGSKIAEKIQEVLNSE